MCSGNSKEADVFGARERKMRLRVCVWVGEGGDGSWGTDHSGQCKS